MNNCISWYRFHFGIKVIYTWYTYALYNFLSPLKLHFIHILFDVC